VTLVIDASVALKWVIEEDGSEAATALLSSETLVAPDFLLVECANVLWTKARQRSISREQAVAALLAVQAAPLELRPNINHVTAAQAIAFDLDQTVYNSLYLAVALAEGTRLITADVKFATAAARHPVYGPTVQLLG
jgi:predicted nucleic acid-binding protein